MAKIAGKMKGLAGEFRDGRGRAPRFSSSRPNAPGANRGKCRVLSKR